MSGESPDLVAYCPRCEQAHLDEDEACPACGFGHLDSHERMFLGEQPGSEDAS